MHTRKKVEWVVADWGDGAGPVVVTTITRFPADPTWVAALTFTSLEGVLELVEVTIASPDSSVTDLEAWFVEHVDTASTNGVVPLGGLTSRLIRRLPLAELQDAAREYIASPLGRFMTPAAWPTAPEDVSRRTGRRGRDDRFYAEIAARYVAVGSNTPNAAVAADLGVTPKQVSNLVHEARLRGLLTKVPRGVAGGDLTAKARALLED